MEDVEVEEVKWLIYPFIPYGKITIIQGDPGEGKTTLVYEKIQQPRPPIRTGGKTLKQSNCRKRR